MADLEKLLRPRASHAWFAWLVFMALTVAACWFGHAGRTTSQLAMAQTVSNARVQQLAARLARERARPVSKEHLDQWILLQRERNVDWDAIFQIIEDATTEDIGLLEFAPDKQTRRIILRGEAKNNAALVAYLDALTVHPQLRDVRLLRRELVEREKVVTVEFQVEAALR